MAENVVSVAYCELNGKELTTVEKISYDLPDVTKARLTMNRSGNPVGYSDGVREFTFDLEVVIEADNPEVDWLGLYLDRTRFPFVHTEGTVRFLWQNCRVTKVGASFDTGGEARRTISCRALALSIQD